MGRVNTVKISGEGISLKQDLEQTIHEPVNTERFNLDTTILINQNLCDTKVLIDFLCTMTNFTENILSGFCLFKIAKSYVNSSFFPNN